MDMDWRPWQRKDGEEVPDFPRSTPSTAPASPSPPLGVVVATEVPKKAVQEGDTDPSPYSPLDAASSVVPPLDPPGEPPTDDFDPDAAPTTPAD